MPALQPLINVPAHQSLPLNGLSYLRNCFHQICIRVCAGHPAGPEGMGGTMAAGMDIDEGFHAAGIIACKRHHHFLQLACAKAEVNSHVNARHWVKQY